MQRPLDLPDFLTPPLTEVYFSIQFGVPTGWREIFAREVWALFEESFPVVEEQPPIPPVFEVFGALGPPALRFNLQPIVGALHSRYWFLNTDGSELVQFQSDRFMRNWRKVPGLSGEYPRFETILAKYRDELAALETFYKKKGFGPLVPNQCELMYLNQMPLTDEQDQPLPRGYYFRNLDMSLPGDPPEFSVNLRQKISTDAGVPIGRLYVDANTIAGDGDKLVLALNLTVRGAPKESSCSSAIQFIEDARVRILRSFEAITSDSAHQKWGRTQ